jgi:hypothetical protein
MNAWCFSRVLVMVFRGALGRRADATTNIHFHFLTLLSALKKRSCATGQKMMNALWK